MLVIAVVGFAKIRLCVLSRWRSSPFPAVIAGTTVVHGVAKHMIDGGLVLNLLCGAGGLFIGIAAMINLYAVGTAVLTRWRATQPRIPAPTNTQRLSPLASDIPFRTRTTVSGDAFARTFDPHRPFRKASSDSVIPQP